MFRRNLASCVAGVLVLAGLPVCVAAEPAKTEPAAPKPQYHFGDITVPAASAEEPLAGELTVDKSLKYLDDGALAWSGARKCVTCHTNGMYLTVRPALTPRVGPPEAKVREFFVETLKAKQSQPVEALQKGTTPEQVIYLAAGLAEWDRHVTHQLSPETDAAMRLMLSIQREDGAWGAVDCWPPYESDSYHPATLAAMALAAAPGWLAQLKDEPLLAAVERLKKYLRTTEPPHDYGRVLLLWSAGRMPGLLDDARRAELVSLLRKQQRDDGGWSIRTFAQPEQWGRGNRAGKLRGEPDFSSPASDGHMTGLALVVLSENGVPKSDPQVAKGLAWLASQQRASGRWWTRSLNTDTFHFITYSGTAYPLLALDRYDAWPAAAGK